MDKKQTNRAKQLPIQKEFIKGVKLIDVDTAIAEYMGDVVIPDLEENEKVVRVPLVYGNAERWAGARKEGYLRDQRGKIQIPLVMFKRNSIERNESLANFREVNTIGTYKKYSPKNRYERFSLQNGVTPAYELYSITVPDYVTITYEVMIWTSFTEHMNKIVEAFQFATGRYWGKEDGFKFKAQIDSFENQQEVGQGSERVIRTTFTMVVNAYLLPERYNEKPTIKKSYSPKRVVFGVETDLTGNLFTQPSLYNEYADIIDFVAIRGSQLAEFVTANTARLTNVRIPILPPVLAESFDVLNWFRIYINGDFISPDKYTYTFDGVANQLLFTFTGLAFVLDDNDEIAITGKFQQL
jgi:hypothetical protein